MDPTLQIVTTCTDRKRRLAETSLRARSLPRSAILDLAANLRKQVQSQSDRMPAADVYAGRSFREAGFAAIEAGCDLRIISAGLGLVSASEKIPAYDLTLVRGSVDSVASRVSGHFGAPTW